MVLDPNTALDQFHEWLLEQMNVNSQFQRFPAYDHVMAFTAYVIHFTQTLFMNILHNTNINNTNDKIRVGVSNLICVFYNRVHFVHLRYNIRFYPIYYKKTIPLRSILS